MASTLQEKMNFTLSRIVQPVLRVCSLFRLRPFDMSSAEGRSSERYRRVAWTAISLFGTRAIGILTSLVSVPLTLHYLGSERYGIWMTMSSLIAMLAFADLGMGNGLLNVISEANGRDDRQAACQYVSSAFYMLTSIAVFMGICFVILYPWTPWERIFNITSLEARIEAGPSIAVFVGCFLVNIPLGIVNRVQMGYQEGFVNSLWQAVGNILGLIGVLLIIYLKLGLPWLVAAMAGPPVLSTMFNGVVLFVFRRPWLIPKWENTSIQAGKRIIRLGILFFILQIVVAIAFTSDNIVAAQVLGPEAVTQYSVPMKIFGIIPMITGIILNPLWPAYSESIARGDFAWVRRTLIRSLLITLLFCSSTSLILVVFGAKIIQVWVGPSVVPSYLLLVGFGVWVVVISAGNAVAVFLNGSGTLAFQVIIAVLMAIGSLTGKIFLARSLGLPGIIWGTAIAYLLISGLPQVIYVPRVLSRIEQRTFTPK